MNEEKKKVVIIGGGITGLSAAYYLQKAIKENKLNIDIILIEASNRLGGKMQTVKKDGFTIERGPDSFLERKVSAAQLIKEVGLENHLTNNATGQAHILLKGQLYPMPEGAVMGIPTKLSPFVTTGLFSTMGKMRAAADLVLPASGNNGEDQSLGAFFRRRLGDEVVENLIEPLLSGIYAGDIDKLSLQATFPQFQQVEQKYRSLILGMKQTTPKKPANQPKSKKGMFQTLTGGLQSLVDEIEKSLIDVKVLKAVKVEQLEKLDEQRYELSLSNGELLVSDSVIITTPHFATANILPNVTSIAPLEKMTSTSVATVAMAFDASAIKDDVEGTGFVVARNSDYTITACTWTHKKWPHTTPEGKILLRCYVGRAGDEAIVEQSDEEIKQVVLDDLNKIMDIGASPDFTIVSRWKQAMPQYAVGHKKMLKEINERLSEEMPGVYLAGSSFEGVGLPDCIDQGKAVVSAVLAQLKVEELVTIK
ncbi:protoporphyrinogen oxidase [Sutcliffiella halmapala]|uniref:protoporphyrinogen oxidase n=1 Tax=Sutcliffiella halmapala TaxID=79882 RepID=UPI0009951910|nr:protoporphyrinogen oxidase [Sutcliffiella halmapala]